MNLQSEDLWDFIILIAIGVPIGIICGIVFWIMLIMVGS